MQAARSVEGDPRAALEEAKAAVESQDEEAAQVAAEAALYVPRYRQRSWWLFALGGASVAHAAALRRLALASASLEAALREVFDSLARHTAPGALRHAHSYTIFR